MISQASRGTVIIPDTGFEMVSGAPWHSWRPAIAPNGRGGAALLYFQTQPYHRQLHAPSAKGVTRERMRIGAREIKYKHNAISRPALPASKQYSSAPLTLFRFSSSNLNPRGARSASQRLGFAFAKKELKEKYYISGSDLPLPLLAPLCFRCTCFGACQIASSPRSFPTRASPIIPATSPSRHS